jgi:Domain of unknown function (DUF4157)
MSDRTNIGRRKVDTSTITNPSLVSSSTPTLANSNHSLSSQSSTALPEISLQALSNQQDTQSAHEQLLEGEAFKQEPLGHDISRVSLRPQAKLSTSPFRDNLDRSDDFSNISLLPVQARLTESWSGNPYRQEVDRVVYKVMPMQIPESNEAVVMRALKETLFRKCAACEEEDERLLMRRTGFGIVQRDETNNLQPPANEQQTPPSPPPQDTATTNPSPEPQLQAIALQQLEQSLNPETIESALGQIDLSGLPISDNTPNSGDSITSTTNLFATPSPTASSPTQETNGNLILRQPTPPTTSSPPANTDANPPRNASTGDLLRAIIAVPEIKSGLTLLRTQASDRITQDWSRLNTGEQIGVVSTSVLIGAGVLTGVFSNPEARRFALDKLNGQVLPVPGVNWLHLELNTGGDNLMLGMHLDIGRLLPSSLGFGPSSPSAIGGVPQPEPLPGQRMIQRQEDNAEVGAGEAIAQRIQAGSGSGSKLDEGVQQHLEQHLGADLSNVQIHTNNEADQLSKSVNAIAFTTGQDIFFSSGSYNPTSTEGQHLIAHEVVHTVQQANGAVAGTPTVGGISISDPSDEFEQEAEQIAHEIVQVSPSKDNSKKISKLKSEVNTPAAIQRLRLEEGPPLAPGNYRYGDKIVSLDEKQMRKMLTEMIVKQGLKEERIWQQAFVEDLRSQKINLHSYEDQNNKQSISVEPTIATRTEQIQNSIETEIGTVESQFQQGLLKSVRTILDASEKQIYKEAHRYGLADDEAIFQPKPTTAGQGALQGSLPESKELRQLMSDAKELLDGKRKVKKARKQVSDLGPILGDASRPNVLEPVLLEYHKTRQTVCTKSPILASFEKNEEKLAELTSGAGQSGIGEEFALVKVKEKVRNEIAEKLSNIAYVRERMTEPESIERFWLDSSLRENTKKQLSVQPQTLANVTVEEKVKLIKEDAEFTSKLKAAIGVGLLILAFVPGAGLAVGAVGLVMGATDIWGAFQQYLWEEAAAGTAFEKAEAISQSDPSLFGLGVSIAFGLLEGIAEVKALEGAIDVFKVLRATYRETRAAAAAAQVGKASGAAELLNKDRG